MRQRGFRTRVAELRALLARHGEESSDEPDRVLDEARSQVAYLEEVNRGLRFKHCVCCRHNEPKPTE